MMVTFPENPIISTINQTRGHYTENSTITTSHDIVKRKQSEALKNYVSINQNDLEPMNTVEEYNSQNSINENYVSSPCGISSDDTRKEATSKSTISLKRKTIENSDKIRKGKYETNVHQEQQEQQTSSSMSQLEPEAVVVVQLKCTIGRRKTMEDRNVDIKCFMTIPIMSEYSNNQFKGIVPEVLKDSLKDLFCVKFENRLQSFDKRNEHFDYIAIFDGHGGTFVAEKLAKRLHHVIKKTFKTEIARSNVHLQEDSSYVKKSILDNPRDEIYKEFLSSSSSDKSASISQSLLKSDKNANCQTQEKKNGYGFLNNAKWINTCRFEFLNKRNSQKLQLQQQPQQPQAVNQNNNTSVENYNPLCLSKVEKCVENSFLEMSKEFENEEAESIGSTAIVTLISSSYLIVANVGDSRAVLCRNGMAYRLSRDHKPENDEEDRIEQAGGRVWDFNGKRVMGLLAMSRAFGDTCLGDYGIISKPEVTIINRSSEDEFLIIACDGLWDVISDQEACTLVSRCYSRAATRGVTSNTASKVAADVLMRVALDKGSCDNITVYVVNLRPHDPL